MKKKSNKNKRNITTNSKNQITAKEIQIDYINEINITETLGKDVNYSVCVIGSYLLLPAINMTITSICLALEEKYGYVTEYIFIHDPGQFITYHGSYSTSFTARVNYLGMFRLGIQILSTLTIETALSNLLLNKLFPRGIFNNLSSLLKQDLPSDINQLQKWTHTLAARNVKLRNNIHLSHSLYSLFCAALLVGMGISLSNDISDKIIINNPLNTTLLTFLLACIPPWLGIASPILMHRWYLNKLKGKSFHIQKINEGQKVSLENFLGELNFNLLWSLIIKGNVTELSAYFILHFEIKKSKQHHQNTLTDIAYVLEESLGITILDTTFDTIYIDSGTSISNDQIKTAAKLFKERQNYRSNQLDSTKKLGQLNLLTEPLKSSEWFSREVNVNNMPVLNLVNFFYVDAEYAKITACLKTLYGETSVKEAAPLVRVIGTECVTMDNLIEQQKILARYVHNTKHQKTESEAPKQNNIDTATNYFSDVKTKVWLPQWSWVNQTLKFFSWSKKANEEQTICWSVKKYNNYIKDHPTRLERLTVLEKNKEKPTNIYALFMHEKLQRQADTTAVKAFFEIFKRHIFLGAGATPNLEGFKFDEKGNLEIKKKGWMGAFRPKGPLVSSDSDNNLLYAICKFSKTH